MRAAGQGSEVRDPNSPAPRRAADAARPARQRNAPPCRLLWALGLAGVLACAAPPPGPDGAAAAREPRAPDLADTSAGAPALPEHVLLVSVAGLVPSHYLDAGGPMPALAEMARAGVAAERVRTVSPPATYPVHATLVTGRPPRDHGVPADRLLGDHGVRRERYSHASHLQGSTLWQEVVDSGGTVLALDWPSTVGAAIPILLPDLLPGRGQRYQALLSGSTTPWLVELAARSNADLSQPGPDRDTFLATAACTVLRSPQPPRLVLLHLTQTERPLAVHGPVHPDVAAAFAHVDALLVGLVQCLAEAGRLGRSAFFVAGDRAFLPVHTAVRINRLLGHAELLRSSDGRSLSSWEAVARSNGGSAFVYARDAEAALAARDVLAAWAERSGAFHVVSAEEMIERQADPEAWFGLDAEAGYVFVDDLEGPVWSRARVRGAGGYLAEETASSPGLVMFGRGVRRGVRAPLLRQLDVAPTAARLLGLALPQAEGPGLVGLLRVPGAAGPTASPQPAGEGATFGGEQR